MAHPGMSPSNDKSPPMRLPRLEMMDRVHRRDRSSSSPGVFQDSSGTRGSIDTWSPGRDRSSLGRNESKTTSPILPHDSRRQHHHGFMVPRLPEPSRQSSMMTGSLPPLSALHSEGPSSSTHGGSSTFAGRPPSRSISHHHYGSAPHSAHPYADPRGLPSSSAAAPMQTMRPSPYDTSLRRTSVPVVTGLPGAASTPGEGAEAIASSRKAAKPHVSSACLNCKRAHLACDSERPCRRCAKLGKTATCVDVQHKKRGRPRLKDREADEVSPIEHAAWAPSAESSSSIAQYGVHAGPPRPLPRSVSDYDAPRNRSGSDGSSFEASARLSAMHMSARPSTFRRPASVTSLLCGLDFVTVLASQESQGLFGLLPSQLCRREIFDFLHPEDIRLFEGMWARLLQPVGLVPTPFPRVGLDMMHQTTCHLLAPARGTILVEDVIRLHTAGGIWAPCHIRLHLGGAFGYDLFKPETRDRAFVVCSIHLAEPGSASAHPNHHEIASTAFDPVGWPGTMFKTPMGRSSPPALPPLSTAAHSPPNRSIRGLPSGAGSPRRQLDSMQGSLDPPPITAQSGELDLEPPRPAKVSRLTSYDASASGSTPASAAASIDTSFTKTVTSPASSSPTESLACKSPPTSSTWTLAGESGATKSTGTSDRFARHPFSSWQTGGLSHRSGLARPSWQPTFSSARSAAVSRLSADPRLSKAAPYRSNSSENSRAGSSSSFVDTVGAVAT